MSSKLREMGHQIGLKVVIVIPTFEERENISILLPRLVEVGNELDDVRFDILVVDDNSPDSTASVVAKFAEEFHNIHLLQRERKEGLGTAYNAGFKYALANLEPDVIFEMDADMSHEPTDIPRLLDEINNGYDFIIGSRYIKGGSTPDWGPGRKIISRGANFLARNVAGIKDASDCTSGFRAIRASVLRKINLDSMETKGYAFQLSLVHKAMQKGAKVKEIPIVFRDRKMGQSKLGKGDIYEFFKAAFRLRGQRA